MIATLKSYFIFLPSLILLSLAFSIIFYLINKITYSSEIIFFDKYYLFVIFFTIYQAFLGATLSVILASVFIGTLYKMNKSKYYWFIDRLVSVPFFIPSIVGCLSLVMVFGQNGVFSKISGYFGFPYTTFLYGIYGIILCHIFYYVPYVLRIFSRALDSLPAEYDQLAYYYNMGTSTKIRIIYYPILKEQIFNSFVLTFMYCFRSFTTILIFGGLPSTTTLEVALYQALNFDLDWDCAAQLALTQIIINSGFSFAFNSKKSRDIKNLTKNSYYKICQKLNSTDVLILLAMLVLFLLPLLCMVFEGLFTLPTIFSSSELWHSLATSLCIGFLSAIIAFSFLLSLAHLSYQLKTQGKERLSYFITEIPANLSMIFSPIAVISIFYMCFVDSFESIFQFIFVIALLNAICFLPSMYRVVNFNYRMQRKKYDNLCALLNVRGISRLKIIDLPALKTSFGYALSICMVFSMSDSRAILFFSQQHFHSLISLLYDKMKTYLFEEAAAIGLLILVLSIFISLGIEKCLGRYQNE